MAWWHDLRDWAEEHPLLAVGLGVGGAIAIGTIGGAAAAGGSVSELLGGGANVPTLSSGALSSSTPSGYARSKLSFARRMWDGSEGDLGAALRTMVPIVWPGVPPEVFVGFCTNGARTANTALSRPAGVENPFAEMGYFGTEGGPRSTPPNAGPYPNPTNTRDNSWLALHADPLVVRALGHEATMAPNGWRTDIPAQAAVGLVNLRKRLDAVNRAAPANTGAANASGTWAVFLAFAGWSTGVGGITGHLRRYAAAIAAAPEMGRIDAYQNAVLADIQAGRSSTWTAGSHTRNPAYTLVRTLQKMYAGRALAEAVGGNVAWFPVPAPDATQTAVTRAAYGVRS